ncbi:MAG: cupin domain-containing protein [Planctomycetia bacterium]|nr:cupin domain-containing protein [Planctomycetia bacterium]
MNNLFSHVPDALQQELTQTLVSAGSIRIERIVSHGHASPDGFWYDQPECEWVVVLHGAARLQFEDESIELQPGDFVHIPVHRKHRVDWTTPDEPTIWLAVFYTTDGPK